MDFVTLYLIFGLIAVASLAYFSVGDWLYQRGITLPFYLDMTEPVSSVSSNTYDNPPAAPASHSAADGADGGLSGGLSALSGLQRHALLSIIMDKGLTVVEQRAVATPKRLVFALVALGWSTSQIRQVVKGDNNALSEQIREAREYFGLVDERVIGVGRDGREVRL